MIDKSIRQHYQDGKKVNYIQEGIKKFAGEAGKKLALLPGENEPLKEFAKKKATGFVTSKIASKLAGTGILSSLGPIGMIIAMMLARKGVDYAKGKIKAPKDIQQALTQGFTGLGVGSPQEQKELRKLESRRQYMLQRKDEGKNYSEKNLDIVTRAIAQAKGLDINNPNEMKNIDKPITQIQIEKRITEAPQIIPETPEIKSPFAKPIPKTPEVISPHLGGDTITPTPTLTTDFAFEDAKRAAQEKAEQERQAAANRAAEAKRAMQETIAQAERDAAVARAPVSVPVPAHISGGGGGGSGGSGGSTGTGAGGMGAPGGGGYGPWRAKGGRVDKALGGRSRDI